MKGLAQHTGNRPTRRLTNFEATTRGIKNSGLKQRTPFKSQQLSNPGGWYRLLKCVADLDIDRTPYLERCREQVEERKQELVEDTSQGHPRI